MVEDSSLGAPCRVVGSNILGTAFAADPRGYFLTAKYVVQGLQAHHLELRTTFKARPDAGYGMFPFGVDAIYLHPLLDIAVLAVPALCTALPQSEQFMRFLNRTDLVRATHFFA